jgi:hypothetical protein
MLASCGASTVAPRPDAHEDAPGDVEATDANATVDLVVDHGRADRPASDGAADVSATDGASDGFPADARDGQTSTDGFNCGTLANTASPVAATEIASLSSVAKGGALTDGIYELVAAEETVSSAPAKFWRTFQISNAGTAFAWVIQDVGLPPNHYFAGSLEVMGTHLIMGNGCGGLQPYPFDAQANTLTLYFLFGATNGRIFHYRAR